MQYIAGMMLRCIAIALFLVKISAFSGWIDPDTLQQDKKRISFTDGEEYDLIMSDEFNRPGRSFKDGHDPMWTGIDKSDDDQTSNGRKSLQFYNHSTISTSKNGHLVIETNTEDTKWKGWNPFQSRYETMSRHFKSGMLQSWNKFCFTGGILEVDVKFPGRSDVGGLWPAVWLLGNLGRATYEESTNLMWPWSYPTCNRDTQKAQIISGCDVTSHYNMQSGKGRGATEIDVIEVMPGPDSKLPFVKNNVHRPYTSMTLQIAPGIPAKSKRPQSGTLPEWGFNWYKNLTYGKNVSINPFFYGTYLASTNKNEPIKRSKDESYQCDAISSMATLNSSYWSKMHTFRLEWQPGSNGYLHWYMNNEFKFGIEANGLEEVGTQIPNEPSYIIFNTAISTSWGFPNPPWGCNLYDCKDPDGQCGMNPGFCKSLPAKFEIDHVRVYQNKNDKEQTIGCNPKAYPTRKYIKAHEYKYKHSTTPYSLLPIEQGGGKCTSDKMCGQGTCHFGECRCQSDWTGPRCLVPTYGDDFPDWEAEMDTIVLSKPYVPTFLGIAGVSVVLVLSIATYYVRKQRKTMTVNERSPVWL